MDGISASGNRGVGLYLHFGGATAFADVKVCLVEQMRDGTLVMRNPDTYAAMAVILAHINMPELEALINALFAHQVAA